MLNVEELLRPLRVQGLIKYVIAWLNKTDLGRGLQVDVCPKEKI